MIKQILILIIIFNFSYANFVRDSTYNIVLDTNTNLIWEDTPNVTEDYKTKTVNGQTNWKATLEYCNNLVINNLTNWRVPNINELKTLIHYNTTRPQLYSDFKFIGTIQNGSELYYISSSPLLSDATQVWRINFYTGATLTGKKDNSSATPTIYLRCVTNR